MHRSVVRCESSANLDAEEVTVPRSLERIPYDGDIQRKIAGVKPTVLALHFEVVRSMWNGVTRERR